LVEPGPRFEEIKIPLPEPVRGATEVSGVLGVPEWWPTGSRVSIVLAHSGSKDMSDELLVWLHRSLTERKFLTLRFNFPFAEAARSRPDPMPVLQSTLRAALGVLGRDPTAAPAHLFLGGKDLGALVAANVAASRRVRAEGIFFLGYPLHRPDDPSEVRADDLFRIVCPMLFVQGTRDRQCDLDTLRRILTRVGAPKALHTLEEADHWFKIPKKIGRGDEELREEVLSVLVHWILKTLES
jgi:hypothetical protein